MVGAVAAVAAAAVPVVPAVPAVPAAADSDFSQHMFSPRIPLECGEFYLTPLIRHDRMQCTKADGLSA